MDYTIVFHEDVIERDLPKINRDIQTRIMSAIKERLISAPEKYGKPLHKTLKGFWKLRVGDYRIVFNVVKKQVNILAVLHRKNVYSMAVKRI